MQEHRLALKPGYQLDHFRIEAVLGKGGFGITYLAVDLRLGKRVAVKELLPDSIATRVEGYTVVPQSSALGDNWQWARQRFLEEARVLAGFSHPAIVGVHHLLEAHGTVYMVMDYVEGESYEARLRRIGREPDEASLMAVMGPILDGLEEVHAKGLLHRDIKPENILINARGQPVLIDFGSARESVGKTMTMTSIVTHGYSPIEQYQTKGRMGPWTDIYAMGAVMCRAMTGEKPPVAADRIVEDEFEWLSYRNSPKFSENFKQAVDWALHVRAEERPTSIALWRPQLRASSANSPDTSSGHRRAEEVIFGHVGSDLQEGQRETLRGGSPQVDSDKTTAGMPLNLELRRKKLLVVAGVLGFIALAFVLWLMTPEPALLPPPQSALSQPKSYDPADFELVEEDTDKPVSPPKEAEKTGWQIVKLGGRDYLPVAQVAAYYKMKMNADGNSVELKSSDRRVNFEAGSRQAQIDSVKHTLSFPVILTNSDFFLSRMDLSKTVDPIMRPERIPRLNPVRTVVLDPGHGGQQSGAVNRYGTEKNYNLDLSRRVRPYLQEAGLQVVITRSGDETLGAAHRVAIAADIEKKRSGTIYVGIQFNASPDGRPEKTGFEVFALTPRGAPNSADNFLTGTSFTAEPGHARDHASVALANAIYHAMLGRVPMFDNGVKRKRTEELRLATVPAVTIHCGFMTNPRDARLMADPAWRERLAESIALGIIEFCELTVNRSPPKLREQYLSDESASPQADFEAAAMKLREKLLQQADP